LIVAGAGELVDHGLDLGQVAIEVVVEHVEGLVDGDANGLRLDVSIIAIYTAFPIQNAHRCTLIRSNSSADDASRHTGGINGTSAH
jgi:hypothetical protein